ncbi:hypothetical protein D3C81_2172790 [compost metagenome]
MILLELLLGAGGGGGRLAVIGQAELFADTQYAHRRYYDLRCLLRVALVLAQVQQDVDIVAR